jgi:hypothetical protein
MMEWEVKENCGGYEYEQDDCEPTHWMRLPEPPPDERIAK